MKKVALFMALVGGFILASCGGKKSESATVPAENAAADTILMDYGTVDVDSVAPDSVEVTVMDTAVEMIAVPEDGKEKKK